MLEMLRVRDQALARIIEVYGGDEHLCQWLISSLSTTQLIGALASSRTLAERAEAELQIPTQDCYNWDETPLQVYLSTSIRPTPSQSTGRLA